MGNASHKKCLQDTAVAALARGHPRARVDTTRAARTAATEAESESGRGSSWCTGEESGWFRAWTNKGWGRASSQERGGDTE